MLREMSPALRPSRCASSARPQEDMLRIQMLQRPDHAHDAIGLNPESKHGGKHG